MTCEKCGTDNARSATICQNCGVQLASQMTLAVNTSSTSKRNGLPKALRVYRTIHWIYAALCIVSLAQKFSLFFLGLAACSIMAASMMQKNRRGAIIWLMLPIALFSLQLVNKPISTSWGATVGIGVSYVLLFLALYLPPVLLLRKLTKEELVAARG